MMEKRIPICAIEELPPGKRQVVYLDDYEEVLVLNVEGQIYALSNICPHEGAALERGIIRKNKILYCPLHSWGFVLASGACINEAALCAPTYDVEATNGYLFLCLS